MSEACPQRRKAEEAVERDIPMVSQLGKEVFPDHFKRVDCEPDRSEADGEERSKDQEQGGADQHVDGFLSCAHAAMILPARKLHSDLVASDEGGATTKPCLRWPLADLFDLR